MIWIHVYRGFKLTIYWTDNYKKWEQVKDNHPGIRFNDENKPINHIFGLYETAVVKSIISIRNYRPEKKNYKIMELFAKIRNNNDLD